MKQSIDKEFLLTKLNSYNKEQKNNVVRHALTHTSFNDLCRSQDNVSKDFFAFSQNIKTMSCTNQKSSGRCWIFAGLNVLREMIAKECHIGEFELSQSFVAFYDKLEKINYQMESIIKLINVDIDDRVFAHVVSSGVEDGGQWDMFVNVVKKYGIVPKNVMDETFQSSNTRNVNSLINVELRKFASEVRKINDEKGIEEVYRYKEEKLGTYYTFLINCYGIPVDSFNFEYVDNEGNHHFEKDYTPLSFFNKYIGNKIDNYVSIINAPTKDKPFNHCYTIDYLGNVYGGKNITHLNLPIERFKELVLKQLLDNEAVWFGCDCGKYFDRDNSIWDIDIFDYNSPFNLDYLTTKEDALDYHISSMDHAMVFTGVSTIDGKAVKWKVENSWGTDKPNKGYYVMDDKWFDYYVYQAVVDKKYLTDDELKQYEDKPIVLKPWDPMGSLA